MIEVFVFRRMATGAEFLLLQRCPTDYLGGTWHPVSGRVEDGEAATPAALRELAEETGLQPRRLWRAVRTNTFFVTEFARDFVCVTFAAEVGADGDVVLSEEHTGARWEPEDRIEAALHWPGQRERVRDILREIVAATPGDRFVVVRLT